MSEREKREQGLKRLQRVKTWQLVVILILALFVTATFLRINNIGMIQRREAVLSADKQGDTDVLKNRLYDLQRYAAAHMNADTGIIYLQDSFNKAWKSIQETAQAQNQSGGENIYLKIENEVCGPQARANGWRWPDARYIACQRNELAKYPQGQELINQVEPPNKELYRHNFISPVWSSDFAGFSVLFCVIVLLLIIARLIGVGILRLLLRKHYKSA